MRRDAEQSLPPILPPGTQVVTRILRRVDGVSLPAGAVAVIVQSPVDPQHAYRLRFPDGGEATFARGDFAVHSVWQSEGLRTAGAADELDLTEGVIFRCIVGSRAYGLEQAASDVDRRGIYLPPAELHWSLAGVPEQLDLAATEECYWELQKFLALALKANPNVLECLYTPLVEYADPLAEELLAGRNRFLSKLVYQTYNGYVLSQFKKLRARLDTDREIKWKHAMHLIRLLLAGTVVLREGVVPVRVDEHRDRLLAIRRGELSWAEIDAWRLELHREFDAAFAATRLPDRPDYGWANALLIRARHTAVDTHRPLARQASADETPRTCAATLAEALERQHAHFRDAVEPLYTSLAQQPYPRLFVTISGAHLYGFPSADSDFDLRGVHVLPFEESVGLRPARETIELSAVNDGWEIDLVTHDALKFFRLLLKRNGYVLEQLHSPLVAETGPEHDELKAIARGCITRHHAHHYLGFFDTQWRLFQKDRRIKPLLYAYRVVLTGIHLVRTGEVEANLLRLNEHFRLSQVQDLVQQKLAGAEKEQLVDADVAFHHDALEQLVGQLHEAHAASSLAEEPSARDALHDLLVRLRRP